MINDLIKRSQLQVPDMIPADLGNIRRLFGPGQLAAEQAFPELRNPHPETLVSASVRATAKASAVLIPIVTDPQEPRVILTERHANIQFAGHLCFPGGRIDPNDTSEVFAALREAEEEIGLQAADVEVVGQLGHYYTQAGYRIRPVIGFVNPAAELNANPGEVEKTLTISLARMLQKNSYRLDWYSETHGHYAFTEDDLRIAGPTVSMMIGLFETLARTLKN